MNTWQTLILYALAMVATVALIVLLDRQQKKWKIIRKNRLKVYLPCYCIYEQVGNTITALKGVVGVGNGDLSFGTFYDNVFRSDKFQIDKIINFKIAEYEDTRLSDVDENITFNKLSVIGVDVSKGVPKSIRQMKFCILDGFYDGMECNILFAYKSNKKNEMQANNIKSLL